ncbi:hypothetical protein [uncultured Jannaschia sp.]|uniref:hypothetical protein n=1 Tax=uncultured Jannaschia sp. TaxID=293347 RepID=UPI0026347806|nr:hypothetical protein [uncultured Jannaschia sp.]
MSKAGEATNWIQAQPYFSELSLQEAQEAGSFSFIWGIFELRVMEVLQKDKSVSLSKTVCQEYAASAYLPDCDLLGEKKYFKERFFDENGEPNKTWNGALFRPADKSEEIKDILLSENSTHEENAEALIRIVSRLRNNFFHGYKWAYNLKGQLHNFTQGSSVLIKLMPPI